jgi:hypothetical protein
LLLLLDGPVLLVRGLVAALLPRLLLLALLLLLLLLLWSSGGSGGCDLYVWKIFGSGKHFLHQPSCRHTQVQHTQVYPVCVYTHTSTRPSQPFWRSNAVIHCLTWANCLICADP